MRHLTVADSTVRWRNWYLGDYRIKMRLELHPHPILSYIIKSHERFCFAPVFSFSFLEEEKPAPIVFVLLARLTGRKIL